MSDNTKNKYNPKDVIRFGSYPYEESGIEKPIEWIVLANDGKKVLLITKYGIDNVKYNDEERDDITWETSSIRKWLNNDFIKRAFTKEEAESIIEIQLENIIEDLITLMDRNPNIKELIEKLVKAGGFNGPVDKIAIYNTMDKVFLLSSEEIKKYFNDNKEMQAYPTPYAKSENSREGGVRDEASCDACSWWLRSTKNAMAKYVYAEGYENFFGWKVNYAGIAVRPALWLDISKFEKGDFEQKRQQSSIEHEKTISAKEEKLRRRCEKKKKNKELENKLDLAESIVGSRVQFGNYPCKEDGTERPIEWTVLANDGKKALLITSYAVDNVRFNDEGITTTWEKSFIRHWLNNDFLNRAFTLAEQSNILTITVRTDEYKKGNIDTQDKIFLLSFDEADEYFISNRYRMIFPTPYARSENSMEGKLAVDDFYNGGSCFWWLRSPCDSFIFSDGQLPDGMYAGEGFDTIGVCPALWIDLEKLRKYSPEMKALKKKREKEIIKVKQAKKDALRKCYVGDYVFFGKYPFEADGTEWPIEWEVLANDGKKALLITKYGIDNVKYNEEYEDTTWETSSIRQWLNGTFINIAFNPLEQAKILATTVITADNVGEYFDKKYHTKGGNDTTDKIFLLSLEEVKKYLRPRENKYTRKKSLSHREEIIPTPYAESKNSKEGSLETSDEGRGCYCSWWLRSPGDSQTNAAIVLDNGFIDETGRLVDNDISAVRPVLWIDLEK